MHTQLWLLFYLLLAHLALFTCSPEARRASFYRFPSPSLQSRVTQIDFVLQSRFEHQDLGGAVESECAGNCFEFGRVAQSRTSLLNGFKTFTNVHELKDLRQRLSIPFFKANQDATPGSLRTREKAQQDLDVQSGTEG
jgi:hypothetical protein